MSWHYLARFFIPALVLVVLVFVYTSQNRQTVTLPTPESSPAPLSDEAVIAEYFAPLYALSLGDQVIQVSVAKTDAERALGLSYTPYLPDGIGKLFVFDRDDRWGIWMREMRYPIDIVWIDESGVVVHIEQAVAPETYPMVFTPLVPSRYVLEVGSGVTAQLGVVLGTEVSVRDLLQN